MSTGDRRGRSPAGIPASGRRRRKGNDPGEDRGGPVPSSARAASARAEPAPGDDPEAIARAVVLRQLAVAPRTRTQLADALVRRGVPDEVVARVLDRFEEVQLIDDREFARQWVETRHGGRGLARRALSYELRRRGIDDETCREAVDRIGDEDELEAARDLVRRRWMSMRDDDPVRAVRRLAGMLARKGYGPAIAFRAVRDVTGHDDPTTGDDPTE